jgi:hypothetical protein
VELQRQYDELRQRGVGLAAVSYDAPPILKAFSETRGITFPLISDTGSAIIKRYGLFNTTVKPDTRAYGVPFPGTLVLDGKGIIRERYFEDAYQERNTVGSILVRRGVTPFGPAVTAETSHLVVTAAVSDAVVAPGKRLSIAIDVEPRPGMHVYAPGPHTYQVIAVAIDPQPWLKAMDARYPPSEIYHFKPLDERVNVYMKPFRIVQDVTILATPEVQKLLAKEKAVTIAGRVMYQACDDKLCYSPESVPVQWTLPIEQLVR